MLAETVERLASTACELKRIAPGEWLTSEEAASYHKKTTKSFDKIAASGTFPKLYPTEWRILYSRKGLNEWLIGR